VLFFLHRWFWEEDDKTWHAYNPGDSDILETISRYAN
jgi:hypothetical protein